MLLFYKRGRVTWWWRRG